MRKSRLYLVLVAVICICLFLASSEYHSAYDYKQLEFFKRLVSFTPFDFLQQSRKTKKNSDVWIRSEEGFNSEMQGIEPLWARIYGGGFYDNHQSHLITPDNKCVVFMNDRRHYYTTIFKVSATGSFDWKSNYQNGFSSVIQIHYAEPCADGGCICTGRRSEPGIGADGVVVKFSSSWDVEWAYQFGARYVDEGIGITQTSDQGYLVVGRTLSFLGSYPEQIDEFSFDLLLVKISAKGDIEKQFSIGGPRDDSYYRVGANRDTSITARDTKYGYLLACDSESFGNRRQIWMVMIDHAFTKVLWQKTYGGKEDEYLNSNGPNFQITPDGEGAIVACFTLSYGVVNQAAGTRSADAWLFKVNLANGKIEWQKTYGGVGADWASCIQPTLDGNYAVVGGTSSFSANNNPDIWAFIVDPKGRLIRESVFGTEVFDIGCFISQTSTKGFYIGGETYAGEESEKNIILLKVDSDLKLYPDCGLSKDSNAIVANTHDVATDTYEILWPTAASYVKENIFTSEDTYLSTNLLCWNLNQAPENVHFERRENKSFFASEAWHTITWSPNPSNNQFSIAEYRIYRKEDREDEVSSYQLIGTVPANMNIFVDSKGTTGMNENAKYLYVVTSVDSEGNESPKSESVGNVS